MKKEDGGGEEHVKCREMTKSEILDLQIGHTVYGMKYDSSL